MRLTELNPRRVGVGDENNIINGVTFDCPHCRVQRLGVMFHPPIDAGGWMARGVTLFHGQLEWQRQGDTFENLTLTPSINTRIDVAGHWHGFITNGAVS